jgi:DNA repair protein RadC
MKPEGTRAPRDTKNHNKGQFLGTYQPKLRIPKGAKCKSTKAVIPLVREIADQRQEFMVMLSIDRYYRVLNIRIIAMGSPRGTKFHIGQALRGALIDDAAGMIFVHNHPSGDTRPSKVDKRCLKRILELADILGLTILDSVIVSGKDFYSMMKNGKMRK